MRLTVVFLLALVLQGSVVYADQCITTCGCCLILRLYLLCGIEAPWCNECCPQYGGTVGCPHGFEAGRSANASNVLAPKLLKLLGKLAFGFSCRCKAKNWRLWKPQL